MKGCEKCDFQYGKIYLNNKMLSKEMHVHMKVASIAGKIHTIQFRERERDLHEIPQ